MTKSLHLILSFFIIFTLLLCPFYASAEDNSVTISSADGWLSDKSYNRDINMPICSIVNKSSDGSLMAISADAEIHVITFYLASLKNDKRSSFEVELFPGKAYLFPKTFDDAQKPLFKFVLTPFYIQKFYDLNVVTLSVNGLVFEFDNKGFGRGKNQLDQCLSSKFNIHQNINSANATKADIIKNEMEDKEQSYDYMRSSSKDLSREKLIESERELFESMKTKMFLLEQEKQAAKSRLTDIRQKEIEAMKIDIGSKQKIAEQADKIKILQEKLQKYQYHQINNEQSIEGPTQEVRDLNINDVVNELTGDVGQEGAD